MTPCKRVICDFLRLLLILTCTHTNPVQILYISKDMIKFILLAEKEILVDGMTHQRSICPQPSTIGAQKDSKWRADFLKN